MAPPGPGRKHIRLRNASVRFTADWDILVSRAPVGTIRRRPPRCSCRIRLSIRCKLRPLTVDTDGWLTLTDDADREIYDYDVDDEGTIIQLGDWYHKPSSVLLEEFFSVPSCVLPLPRLPAADCLAQFASRTTEVATSP